MSRSLAAAALAVCLAAAACLAGDPAYAGNRAAQNYGTAGGAVTRIGGTLEVMPGGTFRLDRATRDDNTPDPKTATAVAGAATLNKLAGVVTSEPLSTAAGAVYVLTLTDARVAAADQVFASVANGTNTAGGPHIGRVQPGAGIVTIEVRNASSAATAFNGTVAVSFMVLKN